MNLTMLLDMATDGFGDRVVLGRKEDGFTPERLRSVAGGGAGLVRAAGADSIVYLGVNGPAFPVALFAAAIAGVPLVPVNYRLGTEQLDSLLANHPRALGIADPGQEEALKRAGLSVFTPEQWISEATNAALSGPTVDADDAEADLEVPAVLIYTSGTTSAPKGVVLKHQNLTAYVLGTVEFAGASDDEASLMSVPPYHIAAVSNVLTNLYAGRRLLTLPHFAPQAWVQLVRDQGVTNAMLVPTMLARIMDAPDLDISVPDLRAVAYGGAQMPPRVIEAALKEWEHVEFANAYGLTETSSTISVLGPDEHRAAIASDDPDVRRRLRSAGKPIPGVDIEIRDANGQPVPTGTPGRVWVFGEQVSGQYAGRQSAVDDRGYFDTRDQGWLDAEGYLYLEGRVDDTIIRGGENISPAEIEDVLLRHPSVADAVVVGVPDDEWGQRIEAVVVAHSGGEVDTEKLRADVRATLRGSKTPDRITCWSELPRTDLGKLVRRDIVATLAGEETQAKAIQGQRA
ncbi:AMP-binding protein [Gordonia sp. HNM0687]|uniref:AMP-binding protein n=1 Tax=Gordonia mangrovi TaxID=2665643 RepID=A0A6L7GVC2_9ACTN|nr:long-chain fatty acid--CoA ligase [Gordonia mangrovi]MXP23432.1 AMP-binding protein [Gordonia mangrovi]UVF76672.1 long-chain fatty acid--CoA ligase [Gordonia mangrovi]